MAVTRELRAVRQSLGRGLFGLVAGPDGPVNRARIHETPGPRWFGEDRPIRRVHADASMFVGGLRALLLQSLHPLAMAGVADHSDYRGDPWGRLQRTSTLPGGRPPSAPPTDAQRGGRPGPRRPPARCRGTAPDGRPYDASRPAPVGVGAHRRDGQLPAGPPALRLPPARPGGLRRGTWPTPPGSPPGLAASTCRRPRPRSRSASRPSARSSQAPPRPARRRPVPPARPLPLALAARAPYALLAAAAVELLPPWARAPLRLPHLPPVEATAIRFAGRVLVGGIRWAMTG